MAGAYEPGSRSLPQAQTAAIGQDRGLSFRERYKAFDRYQQRHAWLGFPIAVRQKYSDDQGGYLAATIAYYGFFAIFPLLLLLVTVLGYLLEGDPALQRKIVDSALGQFPVIGDQLQQHALRGSGLALTVGIVGSAWFGIGVTLAAESAFNHLWGVPFKQRPNPLRRRLRALAMLLLLGGGSILTTLLAGVATVGASYGIAWKIGGLALSLLLNFGLFWTAFRLLTGRQVPWRELRLGAAIAGVLWGGLQAAGSYYVGHQVQNAGTVYGTFALVIGLLSWIYLGAHIILLAAETNVVAARRLWPRSFSIVTEEPRTDSDERALRQRAHVEERRQDQQVEVRFGDPEGRTTMGDAEGRH
jgi:membrane protein